VSVDDDERQRLIAAAWSILERTDFGGLKVQRVAAQARLSTRSFYRHFADKDQLLLVLVRQEIDRAADHLRRAVQRADDPVEAVRAWITAVIGAAADPARVDRARLFTLVTPELRRKHDSIDIALRALWEPLRAAIGDGRQMGVFHTAHVDRDALIIHELAGARLRSAIEIGRPDGIDGLIEETVDFVLRALLSNRLESPD
jgi:AcrR family transcriptional regulator